MTSVPSFSRTPFLSYSRVLGTHGLALFVALGVAACDGAASIVEPPPPASRVPPKPDAHAPTADGAGRVYAIRHIRLGATDPNDVSPWMDIGYDLDRRFTTNDTRSTQTCSAILNASPKYVLPDGNDGIDNSFGKELAPLLNSVFANDAEGAANDSIEEGDATLLLWLTTLGDGSSYSGLDAYAAGARAKTAAGWQIASETIADPTAPDVTNALGSAHAHFADSYVTGNTWVSGRSEKPLVVELVFRGIPLHLRIHDPIVTMQLSSDHAAASSGVIAGVLDNAELADETRLFVDRVPEAACSQQTADSIVNQVSQASDILGDESDQPSVTCDATSIGLAFDAVETTLTGVADEPADPDPCAM